MDIISLFIKNPKLLGFETDENIWKWVYKQNIWRKLEFEINAVSNPKSFVLKDDFIPFEVGIGRQHNFPI